MVGVFDGIVVQFPEVYAESICAVFLSRFNYIWWRRTVAWPYSPSFKSYKLTKFQYTGTNIEACIHAFYKEYASHYNVTLQIMQFIMEPFECHFLRDASYGILGYIDALFFKLYIWPSLNHMLRQN